MRQVLLMTVLLLVTGFLTACDNNQQSNQTPDTDETTQTSTDTTTTETPESTETSETTTETPETTEPSETNTSTESTETADTTTDADSGDLGINADTLVVGRISQPESLDPAWNFDTASNEVLKHIYMGLFEFEGASVNSFVPAIAAEIPLWKTAASVKMP